MAVPATAPVFYELVLKSELIDAPRLQAYIDKLTQDGNPPNEPRECARQMINAGLLTEFQAKLLLQGKWRNFFIAKKYKVLEQIGVGGMGTVFLCEHRHMRRRVALKILPPEKSKDEATMQRFYREARAVAMLNHPNIVRAHDIDRDGPIHFIVMEYVDGLNLQQLVDGFGPLSVERAVNYICQAAEGLQHAHKSGLIHRDIKPANLLLERTGTIKILDLGLARLKEDINNELTRMNDKSILGTADYLAPEQAIDASSCDIRADIYALGATFYMLLLGRPMFDSGNIAQKLIWHQTREPQIVDAIRRDVPAELARVIHKMVAKKPIDRFQTPADVRAALGTWFQPVAPPSPEEMPMRRYSSHGDFDTISRFNGADTIQVNPNVTRLAGKAPETMG